MRTSARGNGGPPARSGGRPPPPTATAVRCLALDALAVSTWTALRDRGIASVVLKGPGLARRLRTERLRRYADVDLLVSPSTFDAAQELLRELGHLPILPDARADDWAHWHERPWRTSGAVPLTIDLHRGFAGVTDPEAFWTTVSSTAERIDLAGGTVAVPDETRTALLVALHAGNPGRSAKPSEDLARALDVLPPGAWRAAAEVARRIGATSTFSVGLRRADQGAALAVELGLPHRTTPVRWIAAHRGSSTAYSLGRLAEQPTLRARLRYFALRLVPSPAVMRYAHPLARRGRSGLLLAYLVRAARLAWRTPAGLREWAVAARLARRSDPVTAPDPLVDVPPPRGRRPLIRATRRRLPTLARRLPTLARRLPTLARRLPTLARGLPALLRVVRRHGQDGLRVTLWTGRAWYRVRRQLIRGGMGAVRPPAPPRTSTRDRRLVLGVLNRLGANCLERSFVLQRWYAGHRTSRTLVIGVSAPSAGFRAHAWLDGDPDPHRYGLVEVLHRPPPPEWLDGPGQET
ncbi:nucleotidyltransferase family protein [Plantactinospora sp. S1510]|uniref:Nucleotidyltransferase family protein n=1 Tax=Plantactinospora alkalitolerans TaxID=2789879 RepID=A0ABS0GWW2_9ACTN|nr:nucleotidyltransferase family protein [Plantactinospora alkalitolerans]MBF9130419.1 nucleotidyltransferase family protein [Plantactinospora alkalitolerans]